MKWENKSCLVTGGSGFLGSHLVDELLKKNANVTVLDLKPPVQNEVEFLKWDVSKKPEIPGNIDFIFHLAALAYPRDCEQNPSLAFNTNVTGTLNMLLLAVEKNIQKFLFPSSAQLYGRFPKYLPVDEKHPIEYSNNFYSTSKKFGEDLCSTFYEKHGLPIVFFRLFNAFGPRQLSEYLIPTIILQALEKGEIELWNDKPTRDFTYVSDTIRAFLEAASSPFCGGPINIGSGKEIQVGQIAHQIASALNANVRFLNKEVIGSMQLCSDISSARKILTWEPEVSFEEGLSRTIESFRKK